MKKIAENIEQGIILNELYLVWNGTHYEIIISGEEKDDSIILSREQIEALAALLNTVDFQKTGVRKE